MLFYFFDSRSKCYYFIIFYWMYKWSRAQISKAMPI